MADHGTGQSAQQITYAAMTFLTRLSVPMLMLRRAIAFVALPGCR
jgi:hypothetical protein